jgi:hypothetical protein
LVELVDGACFVSNVSMIVEEDTGQLRQYGSRDVGERMEVDAIH